MISNLFAFLANTLDKWSYISTAELYLSKSVDRADFDYREKNLKYRSLL